MKRLFYLLSILIIIFFSCESITPQTVGNASRIYSDFGIGQFSIPAGAELLESVEFKNDGIPYMIERRYRLPSGEIFYAYWDVEGSSSVTYQRIEQTPLLALGTDINIIGLPGYREFNFRDDRRRLVQFMKLFKLGQRDFRGNVNTPSLSDSIFNLMYTGSGFRNEFKLLLDLLDETWVLEQVIWDGRRRVNTRTTAIVRVNEFNN
jgi:hypothetical protein